MNANRPTVLTAIASGKGGTGKTFLATTLAQALSREGERVLLFDGDLGLSNIAVQLGSTKTGAFSSVLSGEIPAHEGAQAFAGGIAKRGGFDVLAAPAGSTHLAATEGPAILRTVASLRLAAGYDRVIIDLGAGIDETVMRFASVADEVIVVLTPDPTALTDAYAFVKLHSHYLSHRLLTGHAPGIVVNQASGETEARAIAQALNNACKGFLNLDLEYLGAVRRDPKVVDAIRRQQPLLTLHPKCPAASDVSALAIKLLGRQRRELALAAGLR